MSAADRCDSSQLATREVGTEHIARDSVDSGRCLITLHPWVFQSQYSQTEYDPPYESINTHTTRAAVSMQQSFLKC